MLGSTLRAGSVKAVSRRRAVPVSEWGKGGYPYIDEVAEDGVVISYPAVSCGSTECTTDQVRSPTSLVV